MKGCLVGTLILLLFVSLNFNSSAQIIPYYVPKNGLMGWWPFTGNADDESGNGNNGKVFGATLTYDRFGAANCAYDFNGISDYIITNYLGILGTQSRAVSFWASSNDTIKPMSAVAWGTNSIYPDQGEKFGCHFNIFAPGATIDGADCAITYSLINNHIKATPNWHHFVFQFDNSSLLSKVQIFMDDSLLTKTTSTFRPVSYLNTVEGFPVQFGRIDFTLPYYFHGILDDIGIWNRALTRAEITALYMGGPLQIDNFVNKNISLTICPNPTRSNLIIEVYPSIKHALTVSIINMLGEEVIKEEKLFLLGKGEIDVSKLSLGFYFVRLNSDTMTSVKSFVKE